MASKRTPNKNVLITDSNLPKALYKGSGATGSIANVTGGGSENPKKNAGASRFPTKPPRIRQDIMTWRNALVRAENPILPFRTDMQMLYDDTVLNPHVAACIERRRELTMLREFKLSDEKWNDFFHKEWFTQKVQRYIWDHLMYGYQLISLGDVVNGELVNPTIIPRTLVSPERRVVSRIPNTPTGESIDEPDLAKYHFLVQTPSETGYSPCGFGLLYKVALPEIYIRNATGYNMDFLEMFGQPTRVLKTNKNNEDERAAAEASMDQAGSTHWLIIEKDMEEFELLVGSTGNGYKAYQDFIQRQESEISKLLLGHADSISSVPGKIGSQQIQGASTHSEMASTPIAVALRDIQSMDGKVMEDIVMYQLMPCLRKMGFDIPDDCKFEYLNDAETRAIQNEKNDVNQKMATIVMTFAQAGVEIDPKWISEGTGIPVEYISLKPMEVATPNPLKEPKDQIQSGKPHKEASKKRDGKQ